NDSILGFSIVPVGTPKIIDNSDATGFTLAGTWTANTGSGFNSNTASTAIGDGSSTATWTFTGLKPGATYQVAVTWPQSSSWTGDAPFTVLDGTKRLAVVRISEQVAPSGFMDAGATWRTLGYYQLTGNRLVVKLSNKASYNSVVADAVHIQEVHGDHGTDDD